MNQRNDTSGRRREEGFALPAAMGALVIMSLLVTAGFFISRQEVRIGVASKHANMAVNIAQAGANEVMANWNGYELGQIGVWSDTTLTDTIASGIWEVSIRNANNYIYLMRAKGTVTEGGELWSGASREIGIVTKMVYADIDPPAALTTRGSTVVKGGAFINGINTVPPNWGAYCTGFASNDTTGVLTNDTSVVGTSGGGTILGSPPYDEDSNIVDSTFTNFGEMDWAELTSLAAAEGKDMSPDLPSISSVEPDTTAAGRCNEATLNNWGDTLPSAPCGSYFPLIWSPGDMVIQGGGFGQGVLLVDGNLDLRGDFLFYGIIIVQGNFETQGSGNRIVGAVMASNSSIDQQSVTGTSSVQYSRCAVQRAILNNASLSRARPLLERSWVDLTAVMN